MGNDPISNLRKLIKENDKPGNQINYQQFHKEKLTQPMGLKASVLRKISNKLFRDLGPLPKREIIAICNELLTAQERYFRFYAFDWAFKIKDRYSSADFRVFADWLKKYVDNWGACDHLCTGPLGHVILQNPDLGPKTAAWTNSKNRWLRRGAAVSLIPAVKEGLLFDQAVKIADLLLTDADDMVQKGFGWMLKDASILFHNEVFDYVLKNKNDMPRTALRYAIERMPGNLRKKAMERV